jgi:hypothetical protein
MGNGGMNREELRQLIWRLADASERLQADGTLTQSDADALARDLQTAIDLAREKVKRVEARDVET